MANNDLTALLGQLLDPQTLSAIAGATGVSANDAKSVIANALPQLLNGASEQAAQPSTLAGFLGALDQHAADDSANIGSFFKNVDLDDGSKIIQHLLGGNTNEVTKKVANNAGVSSKATSTILAAAAPLLMTLLGKQLLSNAKKSKKATTTASNTDLLAALLGANTQKNSSADLLGALLGGGSSKKSNNLDTLSTIAGLVGTLLK
ncbi:MAG: DUF937 domain-containing protein [Erysipelotrichaceae bacterium]|nr:DUF937 domain-containing protein [Erysipelotrichaceae bacterium]